MKVFKWIKSEHSQFPLNFCCIEEQDKRAPKTVLHILNVKIEAPIQKGKGLGTEEGAFDTMWQTTFIAVDGQAATWQFKSMTCWTRVSRRSEAVWGQTERLKTEDWETATSSHQRQCQNVNQANLLQWSLQNMKWNEKRDCWSTVGESKRNWIWQLFMVAINRSTVRQLDRSKRGQVRPVCEKCGKCVFYEMYPERVQHNTIEHCVKDVCRLRLPSKCVNLSLHHFFCTWPEFNFLLSLPFPIFPISIPKPIPISFQFRFAVHFRFGCYNFNASPSSSTAQSVWAQTA